MCSQEPPERPIALANSVLYVFPTTSDGLPLQASDKLCCVNMALPRDCEVWVTDGIRAVTVGKHLIQEICLSRQKQPGRFRSNSKAAQLRRDGIIYSLEKSLTLFLLCA